MTAPTVTGPGMGTQRLQARLPAVIARVFAQYGHDLTVVFPDTGEQWGTPGSVSGLRVPVRGFLEPASAQTRNAARSGAAGLPIPAFEAMLPFDAVDLSTPGWYIEHAGQRYYPIGDARSEGGQGLVWSVTLSSPGEVTDGTSEPGWNP